MFRMLQLHLLGVTVFVLILAMCRQISGCNEAVCASVVSKCMLTQSCKCDLKNCSCCKECFSCLNHLYSECCSCVDMCPKPNETGSALGTKSLVEDFHGPIPSLFAALTADVDPRWQTITFPVDANLMAFLPKPEKEVKYRTQSADQDLVLGKNSTSENCTVVYMNQCSTWNKCMETCETMGSASYRWFHDGCCECVGSYCINYGINESRCKNCPATGDDEEEDEEEKNDLIYDTEDDDMMDNEK
ncbi:protein twisted gastrulation [Anabrus simplex]|uniref:protein twisted gastrulation n=1 Tax=Anabrus simplex TaxID=316456 RepID=UPI0034DCEE3B